MIPVDPRTVAYWPLAEQYDSILPVDVSPSAIALGLIGNRPTVVSGTITGFGREFTRASGQGFLVSDTGALRLTRAMTVAALLRLDLESVGAGNTAVIVQRGHGGAGNARSFRFALEVVSVIARQVRVRLSWQTEAGADVLDTGVLIIWPAAEYLFVAASREVVGGLFTVSYQVNGESASGGAGYALDCGGSTNGWLTLGLGLTSVGGSAEHRFDGVLDSVQILNEAVSREEFEWTWHRLASAQPEGVATMRALVPPGVYSTDPSSMVQRELAVEGAALGQVKSLAERLRLYSLPDRAWGAALERWESLTAHEPQPADDIGLRRARLVAFTGTVRGFAEDDVRAQLAAPFGLALADVQLLEYGNDLVQSFAADPADGISSTGNGTIAFAAGELAMAGAAANLRYGGMSNPRAPHYLWPLAAGDDSWTMIKVRSVAATTGVCVAGLMIGRRDIDEWAFIGIDQTAATPTNSLVWLRYRAGVLSDDAVFLATVNLASVYLWVRHVQGGTFEIRYGSTAVAARAATPIALVTGHASPLWVGAVVVAPNNILSASPSVAFDDLLIHAPNGGQRFNWFAYRNPVLPGTPDIFGARLVVNRIKPAHTFASATTVLALVCDDAGNGCEQAPIGR